MLTLWITLVIASWGLSAYFYVKTFHPLKVWNRPGYWMALRWARWFAWQAFRGKVDCRKQHGILIWEAWPKAESWVSSTSKIFILIQLALVGVQFRMDETDSYIAMEVHPDDQ